MHILCTICTDSVNPVENLHVTNCGHLFHYHCLSEWMTRSNTCPQCRRLVTNSCIFRVYPTVSDEIPREIAALQKQLDDAVRACEGHKENEDLLKLYTLELDDRNAELKSLQSTMQEEIVMKNNYMMLHNNLTKDVQKLKNDAIIEKLEHSRVLDENRNKLLMQNHKTERFKIRSDIMKKNIQLLKKTLLKAEFDKKELCRKLILAEHASIAEKFVSFSQRLKLGQISQQNLVKTLVRIHALLLTSQKLKNNTDNEVNMPVMLPENSKSEDSTTIGNRIDDNTSPNLNLNKDSESNYSEICDSTSKDVSKEAPDFDANVASGSQYFRTPNSLSKDVKDTPNLNLHLPTESQCGNSSKNNDVVKEKSGLVTKPLQTENIFINRNTFNETPNLELNLATGISKITSKDTSLNQNVATGVSDSTSKDIVKEISFNLNVATGSQDSGIFNNKNAKGDTKMKEEISETTPEPSTSNLNSQTVKQTSSKEAMLKQDLFELIMSLKEDNESSTIMQPKKRSKYIPIGPQNDHLDNLISSLANGFIAWHLETKPAQSELSRKSDSVFKFSSTQSVNVTNKNTQKSKDTSTKDDFKKPEIYWYAIAKYALSRSLPKANDESYSKRDIHLKEFVESMAKINWPKYLKSQVHIKNTLIDETSTLQSQIPNFSVTKNEKPLFEMFLKRFEKRHIVKDNVKSCRNCF